MKFNFGKSNSIRVFSAFLSFALLISTLFVFPASAATQNVFDVWDGSSDTEFEGAGTKDNPYKITSAAELYGFATDKVYTSSLAEEYYVLTTDIYLNDVSNSDWINNSPKEWVSNKAVGWGNWGFAGHFDGQGHTVYGMYYANYNANYAYGLIPKAVANAEITNVNVRYAYAASNGSTGINFGTIVGFVENTYINDASVGSNVSITKCVVDDTVDLRNLTGTIGGIVGPVRESNLTVRYCGSAAIFNSTNDPAGKGGGIICQTAGWAPKSVKILNSYSVYPFLTDGFGSNVALSDVSDGTLYSVYTSAWWRDTAGINFNIVDNMRGMGAEGNMINLGWDVWQANRGAYPTIQGSTAFEEESGLPIWDGTAAYRYNGGTGEAGDPYKVATPEQLRKMVETTEIGKYYLITSDIYLNDIASYASWVIAAPENNWWDTNRNDTPFQGHVDGDGHTIYGLYSSVDNITYNRYAGLIANIGADSSITNLHIRKSYINGGWAGAFVGATNGTSGLSTGEVIISGCSADETVTVAGMRTAGIIGCALAKITINDSYSSATLSGTATKGGAYADVWGNYANIIVNNFYSYGWHMAAIDLNSPNWDCKIPGTYSFHNAYYIGFGRPSWGGMVEASDYSDLSFDSDAWYGISEKLLKNRGLRNCDVVADDGDAPNAEDITVLKRILLGSETAEGRIADVNSDNAVNILDLVRLKKATVFF